MEDTTHPLRGTSRPEGYRKSRGDTGIGPSQNRKLKKRKALICCKKVSTHPLCSHQRGWSVSKRKLHGQIKRAYSRGRTWVTLYFKELQGVWNKWDLGKRSHKRMAPEGATKNRKEKLVELGDSQAKNQKGDRKKSGNVRGVGGFVDPLRPGRGPEGIMKTIGTHTSQRGKTAEDHEDQGEMRTTNWENHKIR